MFKKYKIEIIIFLSALVLRLAVAGIVYGQNNFNYEQFLGNLTNDGYYEIAQNLINHGIFSVDRVEPVLPSSVRTPGYPALIVVSLYVFGSIWPLLIFQIIIGSLLPLLGRRISLEITGSNKVSNLAALFLAIEPMGIWLSLKLLTETFFTWFFFLFVLLIFKFIKVERNQAIPNHKNLGNIILAGLFLGIATLIRPTTFYFPVILAIGWIIYRYFLKRELLLKYLLVLLVVFSIIVAPWLYRNYKVFGVAEISSVQAEVLFGALAPSVLAIKNQQSFPQAQKIFFASQGFNRYPKIALDNAGWFQSRAIEVFKENPKSLARLSGISLLTFFTHDGVLNLLSFINAIEPTGLTVRQIIARPLLEIFQTVGNLISGSAFFVILARLLWILIFILFILGVAYVLIKKRFTVFSAFALACVVYFALTTISNGFGVNARFRFPVNVFIFIFAFGFLNDMINNGKDRISGKI